MRRTKIVATAGPVSNSPENLAALASCGVDIFRLNFSHGTQKSHGTVLSRLRDVESDLSRPIPVLQDLAGPKIRIGSFEKEPVNLNSGDSFSLITEDTVGTNDMVSVNYSGLPSAVEPGHRILLSDGALELKVVEVTDKRIECEVLVGGTLSSHKGVNLPAGSVDLPVFTEKDRNDLKFGLEHGVDYVAVSFVRNADDLVEVREAMDEAGRPASVIAKIEKHEAIDNIDAIIDHADGLMIARGDLGVETPIESIPRLQKKLTALANRTGKPVITATHMLRSMVSNPRPTRAEVTDIANAVLDGSDAIMLSEETAVGQYPVQSVDMMKRTIERTEEIFPYREWSNRLDIGKYLIDQEAVAEAACRLAEETRVAAIVTMTLSGSTTACVAKHRPSMPILALTPDIDVWRRLGLVWGVLPRRVESFESSALMEEALIKEVLASGLARCGQKIVVVSGGTLRQPGGTNTVRVLTLDNSGNKSACI